MSKFKTGDRVSYNDCWGMMPDYLGITGTVRNVLPNGNVDVTWDNGNDGAQHMADCLTLINSVQDKATTATEVTRKWAAEIQNVVDSNTIGDYTWIGLLSQFVQEYNEVVKNAMKEAGMR